MCLRVGLVMCLFCLLFGVCILTWLVPCVCDSVGACVFGGAHTWLFACVRDGIDVCA